MRLLLPERTGYRERGAAGLPAAASGVGADAPVVTHEWGDVGGGTCRRRPRRRRRKGRPLKPSPVAPPSPPPLAVARVPLLGLAGTEMRSLDEKGRKLSSIGAGSGVGWELWAGC